MTVWAQALIFSQVGWKNDKMHPNGRITTSDKCFIWLLMFYGMLPFRLHTSSGRFVESNKFYWASVFLGVLYCVSAPIVYWNAIISSMHPSTPLNNYMIVMQFIFMCAVVILTRFEAITNYRKLMQLLNNMIMLREQTSRYTDDHSSERRLSRWLWAKVAIFDVGIMMLSGLFFNPLDEHVPLKTTILGYGNLVLVSTMSMTANFLLVVQYRADYIYRQINARTGELMRGAETPDGIVKLYLMHVDTTVTVQCFLEVMSKPVLLLNLWYFFIIVFAVFYAYTSVVQDIQETGTTGGNFNVLNPLFFFVSEVGQLCFLVAASAQFTERARSIIQYLCPFSGRVANEPNDRAIELLTIEYLTRDYTVHIKGLYAIDYTMLFSIVASTTSYMIILVQFYLQELN